DETREQLRLELQDHFAKVSAALPFWKRIKVLHLWDSDLPRTATRKVKRPPVVAELLRLERAAEKAIELSHERARDGGDAWLYQLVADLARKPPAQVG